MKKDTTVIRILPFAILLNCIACKKNWLDNKPSQQVATISTLNDCQALIDNENYMTLAWASTLGEIASDGHYMTDARFNLAPSLTKNVYTWSNNLPVVGSGEWGATYQKIFYTNLVLEGLQNIQAKGVSDQQLWNNIKGQALFFRGMSFFELANQWATPFDSSSSKSDLGIPIRLESDISIPTTRSTVEQTYDQIINDLNAAKDLLPLMQPYPSRPSKTAVFALLARIYLSVGSYEDAKRYADSTLSLYNTLIDFSTLNITPTTTMGHYNKEVIFLAIMQSNSGLVPANCFVDSSLYSSYSSNDLRKTAFFVKNANGTINFHGNYTYVNSLHFMGLATDEIYLVRSECLARSGDVAAAMRDLNDLLRTRWTKVNGVSTYIDQTATTVDDALNKILLERRKELIFRGLRWTDLRRLNKDPRFSITITRTINGTTFNLTPNSYKYTLPIPTDIIHQSGIEQNAGW